MRDRVQQFTALGIQLLTVIAQDAYFVRGISGADMPKSCPFPLLLDPSATVSATYGAAFQTRARGFWSNRQLTFVIDGRGVIRARFLGHSPRLSCMAGPSELRGGTGYDLLTSVVDLLKQRRAIAGLSNRDDEALRRAVEFALEPIGSAAENEVATLISALGDDDEQIRLGAAAALSWLAPVAEQAIPALTEAVADANADVRRLAITAIGRMGPSAATAAPQLVQAFGEDDANVHAAARLALRRLDAVARPALIAGLQDKHPRVRISSFSLLLDGSFTVDERHPDTPVLTLSLRHKASVTDDDLVHIRGLARLQALDLSGTSITDAGVIHLQGLNTLEVLRLGPRTGNAALERLTNLDQLRQLTVGRRTTDQGLAHISRFNELRELVANGTRITGSGLAHLRGLEHLRTLRLRGTPLRDEGLMHLRGLSLRKLQLGKTQITAAGLAHLQYLPQLEQLNLRAEGKRITDAGIAHLQQVTSLKHVQLGNGTAVTRAAQRRFEKALPEARIGF